MPPIISKGMTSHGAKALIANAAGTRISLFFNDPTATAQTTGNSRSAAIPATCWAFSARSSPSTPAVFLAATLVRTATSSRIVAMSSIRASRLAPAIGVLQWFGDAYSTGATGHSFRIVVAVVENEIPDPASAPVHRRTAIDQHETVGGSIRRRRQSLARPPVGTARPEIAHRHGVLRLITGHGTPFSHARGSKTRAIMPRRCCRHEPVPATNENAVTGSAAESRLSRPFDPDTGDHGISSL